MHPEVQEQAPGFCPVCGMVLELVGVAAFPDGDQREYREYKGLKRRFWIAFMLSLPLLLFNMGEHFILDNRQLFLFRADWFSWKEVQLLLATPVVFWCGCPFFERAWVSIKTKSLNMFTLIALGVSIAYFYSLFITVFPRQMTSFFGGFFPLDVYFESAAVITTVVLLGHMIELKTRLRTNQAIYQLLNLAPPTATLINADQTEVEVSTAAIQVGDLIRIRPGDKIPVDGVIVQGNGVVDQSMVTGEHIPVEKRMNDAVIGGTLNNNGSFVMRAMKVGHQTLLAQIVDMVAKAQRTKAPIQKVADQVSAYFVPLVIGMALLTFWVWLNYGPEPSLGYAVFTSVAVLVIACPCAVGLAVPMSMMVATGCGAQAGILIKNAAALERLAKVDVVIFDKTGTITEGTPRLIKVQSLKEVYTQTEILRLAASLARGSHHPLAMSILKAAESHHLALEDCQDVQAIAGQGMTGSVRGKTIVLGNQQLMSLFNIDISVIAEQIQADCRQGYSVILIGLDGELVGFLTVADNIKVDALPVISSLRKQGLTVVMLTGDHTQTAQAIAREVGIEEVYAEVLPQHKYEYIHTLQAKGLKVAMVGDGVNDAPALAQADVSIAVGNGADIAMATADITLISGSLRGVIKAKKLSEYTLKNIQQNLCLAFIYNIFALPIAAGLFYPAWRFLLSPAVASVAMTLSSLSVVLNALRLATLTDWRR
jgi:Cu+-exporting ATPase